MIELENRFDVATEFQAMAERVLNAAKAKGATAAELEIDKGTGLSVEVRMGQVDKLQYHRDQGINLTVYFGHRKGFASTADFSPQALEDTLEAACRIRVTLLKTISTAWQNRNRWRVCSRSWICTTRGN